jgi:putative transposase
MSFEAACRALELNSRAVYRWKSGQHLKAKHGGGGGKNKITPLEQERVLRLARRFPTLRCRRIAYSLERKALAFVGKTKVAEILKANGLNHQFVRGIKKVVEPPAEILLHEPWACNLLWGMDWTWVHVGDTFHFLLVIVDWYSRLIVAWGLFRQITRFEVTATITDAVAAQKIDQLPEGTLKPRIVADHGSANCAQYTRSNIEIQGLELWLCGIGRPTGNARTERTIGTLKHEEISLQDQYTHEEEAQRRIGSAIADYNHRRPNAGNGGFAPIMVHMFGRKFMIERRESARQLTREKRRKYWDQETPC